MRVLLLDECMHAANESRILGVSTNCRESLRPLQLRSWDLSL